MEHFSPANEYWTSADVESCMWIVMNGKAMRKLNDVTDSDGHKSNVFVSYDPVADRYTALCRHGECASTILSWVNEEKFCLRRGKTPPKRNSACDCQNSDGLHFKDLNALLVSRFGELPRPPANDMLGMLRHIGTRKQLVQGREMRHVPDTEGEHELFLSAKGGHFCCRHGSTMRMLRSYDNYSKKSIVKKRSPKCECNPRKISWRWGSLPLTCKKVVGTQEVAREAIDSYN